MNCSSGIGVVRLKRDAAVLWAILIAALGVRLAYLYQAVDTPLFDVLLSRVTLSSTTAAPGPLSLRRLAG